MIAHQHHIESNMLLNKNELEHANSQDIQKDIARVQALMQNVSKLIRKDHLLDALDVLQEIILIQKSHISLSCSEQIYCGELAAARTFNNLGVVHKKLNNLDEAMKAYSQSLCIKEKVLEKDHPDLVATLSNIGSMYVELREFDKAMNHFLEAGRVAIISLGSNHVTVANILNNTGYLRDLRGEYNEALQDYEKSLRIYIMSGFPETDPVVDGTIRNIQQVLSKIKLRQLSEHE